MIFFYVLLLAHILGLLVLFPASQHIFFSNLVLLLQLPHFYAAYSN